MAELFSAPPATIENPKALYSYLYQMSEKLNYAYAMLESGERTAAGNIAVTYQSLNGNTNTIEYDDQQYNELKSLIIKTGNAVTSTQTSLRAEFGNGISSVESKLTGDINSAKTELNGNIINAKSDVEGQLNGINTSLSDQISALGATMESDYVANSVFGDYKESIAAQYDVTAENVTALYSYQAELNAAQENIGSWKRESQQYIRTGIIRINEHGNAEVGVAIGDVEGAFFATFVSDSLTFWDHGNKVAYFSNETLYVQNAEILGKLRIGNYYFEVTARGLEVRWEENNV